MKAIQVIRWSRRLLLVFVLCAIAVLSPVKSVSTSFSSIDAPGAQFTAAFGINNKGQIVGSYSNIVGLPLYETTTLLAGEGYPIRVGWINVV